MGKGQRQSVRVVIDTNVLVSALLFGGLPGRLQVLWEQGRPLPLLSRPILNEYLQVLAYPKFSLSEDEISFLLEQHILPFFEVVTVHKGASFVPDDPADDKFIWCAQAGQAECIVSGDTHLLALAAPPVPVFSPAELLRQINDRNKGAKKRN